MLCPYCKEYDLEKVDEYQPWYEDYYICTGCDSTYTVHEVEKVLTENGI